MTRARLRLGLALAVLVAGMAVLSVACNYQVTVIWLCLDPATGKEDSMIYDANHYAPNGVFDPCHCYSTCGPSKACPIVVDAGPSPTDAGCMEGGDPWDGGG